MIITTKCSHAPCPHSKARLIHGLICSEISSVSKKETADVPPVPQRADASTDICLDHSPTTSPAPSESCSSLFRLRVPPQQLLTWLFHMGASYVRCCLESGFLRAVNFLQHVPEGAFTYVALVDQEGHTRAVLHLSFAATSLTVPSPTCSTSVACSHASQMIMSADMTTVASSHHSAATRTQPNAGSHVSQNAPQAELAGPPVQTDSLLPHALQAMSFAAPQATVIIGQQHPDRGDVAITPSISANRRHSGSQADGSVSQTPTSSTGAMLSTAQDVTSWAAGKTRFSVTSTVDQAEDRARRPAAVKAASLLRTAQPPTANAIIIPTRSDLMATMSTKPAVSDAARTQAQLAQNSLVQAADQATAAQAQAQASHAFGEAHSHAHHQSQPPADVSAQAESALSEHVQQPTAVSDMKVHARRQPQATTDPLSPSQQQLPKQLQASASTSQLQLPRQLQPSTPPLQQQLHNQLQTSMLPSQQQLQEQLQQIRSHLPGRQLHSVPARTLMTEHVKSRSSRPRLEHRAHVRAWQQSQQTALHLSAEGSQPAARRMAGVQAQAAQPAAGLTAEAAQPAAGLMAEAGQPPAAPEASVQAEPAAEPRAGNQAEAAQPAADPIPETDAAAALPQPHPSKPRR